MQDLLDVVQKERDENNRAGFETVRNSSYKDDLKSHIDFEVIQANIAAAEAFDPSERTTTPD